MNNSLLFQSLTKEKQIDFFVNCQKILIENHQDSEFLLTKENIEEKKYFALNFIKKYKGYAYWNNNVSILFNKFKIKDSAHPIKELKDHIYREPEQDYNCILIDFATFSKFYFCLNLCKQEYNEQIKYILFIKNNQIKLYDAKNLINKINSVPKHLLYFP